MLLQVARGLSCCRERWTYSVDFSFDCSGRLPMLLHMSIIYSLQYGLCLDASVHSEVCVRQRTELYAADEHTLRKFAAPGATNQTRKQV
jgi:hypothetical protein